MPAPPPDADHETADTRGPTDPSGRFTNPKSTAAHAPRASRTRTGANASDVVIDLSGFTHDVEVADRNDSTSTRDPCARADNRADTTSGADSTRAARPAATAGTASGSAGTAAAAPSAATKDATANTADTHTDRDPRSHKPTTITPSTTPGGHDN